MRTQSRRRRVSFAPWLRDEIDRRKDTKPFKILRIGWIVILVLILFVIGGSDLAEWLL